MNNFKKSSFSFVKYLSLIIAVISAVLPITVVFFTSFKTKEDYMATNPLSLPKSFLNIDNYVRAFTEGNMLRGFGNTIIILVISLIGAILLGTMTAYVIHRFQFRARNLIMAAFLFATLIPGVTTQVATFQIINALNLYNTRAATILLFMGTDIIAVYIFLQFMDSIPVSLDESAMLDGASYLTIYRKIIMPLLKPAIVTVMIIKGVANYNNFYIPFLYMPSEELQVVSTALFKFKGPYGTAWEVISAGCIIAIIPTLIMFIFAQKWVYNGITQGSVK